MTPRQALAAGADYLVVGRPISAAPDPAAAASAIQAEIGTLSVAVKICGLSEQSAVAAAVASGAAFLGFVFYPPSPRNVGAARVAELCRALPAGIARVGLFVDADDATIAAVLDVAPLDLLQLHGSESPARVAAVKSRFAREVMKALPIADAGDVAAAEAYLGIADRLLFDARPPRHAGALPGGNGLVFDWRLIAGRSWSVPWMLSGGLTEANVAEGVRLTGAPAVDVSSGSKARPASRIQRRSRPSSRRRVHRRSARGYRETSARNAVRQEMRHDGEPDEQRADEPMVVSAIVVATRSRSIASRSGGIRRRGHRDHPVYSMSGNRVLMTTGAPFAGAWGKSHGALSWSGHRHDGSFRCCWSPWQSRRCAIGAPRADPTRGRRAASLSSLPSATRCPGSSTRRSSSRCSRCWRGGPHHHGADGCLVGAAAPLRPRGARLLLVPSQRHRVRSCGRRTASTIRRTS